MDEEIIFAEATRRADPAERAAYLQAACGRDEALRRRVEELLAAHEAGGSFLEPLVSPPPAVPASEPPAGDPSAEPPGPTGGTPRPTTAAGTAIGPYRLIQPIGEGGMGTVYLAEQTSPVRRTVTLKVIKPGMDSRQVLSRFEAERQALALMDHPNIAKVLDAGTTAHGRPYFVMELVRGKPITTFCDERRLDPRERLELFVSVCQAVQHAHQKGIIHRDIKPGNVLVALYDGRPVPKVIDFGVAKAVGRKLTAETVVTGFGHVVGTPEYMSPEQAELNQLDIDTRSDVYSLGVLLYELLTGTTPLRHRRIREIAILELLRLIREEEPPRPSHRLSSTEELPSIAANRGVEPRRLTGLVLGDLDWIVMKALEKDRSRRYETANGLAMDVRRYLHDEEVQACPPSAAYRLRKFARRNRAAMTLAGLSFLFLLVLGSAAGWVVRDRVARRDAVRREVDASLAEAAVLQAAQKWPEAISAVRRAEGFLSVGGTEEVHRRAQELRKDLELALRLEDLWLLQSNWRIDHFDHANTDEGFTRAFAEYGIDVTRLSPEEATARIRARPGVAPALFTALDRWTCVPTTDREIRQRLLRVADAVDPDRWRRDVREARERGDGKRLASLATSAELWSQPGATVQLLARGLGGYGRKQDQLDLLRRAQRRHPGDFWFNYDLAVALDTSRRAQLDESISYFRAALAIRPRCTAILNDLAICLYRKGELEQAVDYVRQAIEIDPDHAVSHSNLGMFLREQGRLDEAIAHGEVAIRLSPRFPGAYNNLGLAWKDKGRSEEAMASVRKAIEIAPGYVPPYLSLCHLLRAQRKFDDALETARKALEVDPRSAEAQYAMGLVHADRNQFDAAISRYRKVLEIDPRHCNARCSLGLVLANQGKVEEAIALLRKALRVDPRHAPSREHLSWALRRKALHLLQGQEHPAPETLEQARAVLAESLELDPGTASLQMLGWLEYRAGRWTASIEALERSCRAQKGGTGDEGQWIVLALAHGKLAEQAGLGEQEREFHRGEARRRYEAACKIIDGWNGRPSHAVMQAIWDFRQEARTLLEQTESRK